MALKLAILSSLAALGRATPLDYDYLEEVDLFGERSLMDARTFNLSSFDIFNSSSTLLGIGAAVIIGIILFGNINFLVYFFLLLS